MSNFTDKELFAIKEVVGSHQIMAAKLSDYANRCHDANIKQAFSNASSEARKSAQNLINML